MDRNRSGKAPQGRSVEGTRTDLLYAQIPLILLRLPTGERAAAIEVWATLHQYLRLGTSEQKISDETLSRSPYLQGRSRRFLVNGLNTLQRLGLVGRQAKGPTRRLAITARLKMAAVSKQPNLKAAPPPLFGRPAQDKPVATLHVSTDEPLDFSPEFMAFLEAYSPAKHREVCAYQDAQKV